jgi:RNA polymerase sigma-70 factor (ECF subfamily)
MKDFEGSETDESAVLLNSRLPTESKLCPTSSESSLSGSSPRFEELYRAHFTFVWRSLRALGVNEANMDDAVQDVFVVVHRQLEGFEQRASLRTWIFAIVHHVASNHRRREQRKGGLVPLDPESPSVHPDPEHQLHRSQAWQFVRQFVDQLDESKRAVFVLTQIEGLKATEVAEMLDIPVNTVYTRLFHARLAFREALAAREFGGSR